MADDTIVIADRSGRVREEMRVTPADLKVDRGALFRELGATGLTRFGGSVYEEFLAELQGQKGIKVFREMRENHPVVNAVFFGIEMALRQVRWFAEAASDKPDDQAAAEFVDQCLADMSFTWNDTLAQILTMLQFGFMPMELVYKVRRGRATPKDVAESDYDDGRTGWRKWLPIAQDTLTVGAEWIFDDSGGIQGLNPIPIEKLLLFRTTVAKNNPEGRSLCRGMYIPWYYSKNLSEVEAIAAERMGTGVPVMYLGEDCSKSGNQSDLELAKQIVRDTRTDDQMGIVIPKAKMGSGAKENNGMLYELLSPPSRGAVDFDTVINRYDKRIALAGLAQFIMLGQEQVGSFALSKDQSDIFVMALGAWAEAITQVITRHALPRLFRLNTFRLEQLPKLAHSEIAVPDLAGLAAFINSLVGAQVLTPDANLEQKLREMAKLPPKMESVTVRGNGKPGNEGNKGNSGKSSDDETEDPTKIEDDPVDGGEESEYSADAAEWFDEQGREHLQAQGTHPGAMVALAIPENIGKQLLAGLASALPEGSQPSPLNELHLTLAYLGQADELKYTPDTLRAVLKVFAAKHATLRGTIGGIGRMNQIAGNDTVALYTLFDSPELPAFREDLRKTLQASGIVIDETHGFVPHVTLAYIPSTATAIPAQIEPAPAFFREIIFAWGGKWETIPLRSPADAFADTLTQARRARGGARYETATNTYQAELEEIYTEWYNRLTKKLAAAKDDDERERLLLAALIILERDLQTTGRRGLLEAIQLGAGDAPLSAAGLSALANAVMTNDAFIESSLVPAIKDKARAGLSDPALLAGGAIAISGVFQTFLGRVASYAGAFWESIWHGVGDQLGQDPEGGERRVQRHVDPGAMHCRTCPPKAKVYKSWQAMVEENGIPGDGTDDCGANCRCFCTVETAPASGVFERI